MLKRLSIAGAGLALVPFTVDFLYTKKKPSQPVQYTKVSELPIYDYSLEENIVYIPEKAGFLRYNIAQVRKVVWKLTDSVLDTANQIKCRYDATSDFISGTATRLHTDSTFRNKISIISAAGLSGIALGYRGGRLRKIVYSGTGVYVACAVCYPRPTWNATLSRLEKIKTSAESAYSYLATDTKNEKLTLPEAVPASEELKSADETAEGEDKQVISIEDFAEKIVDEASPVIEEVISDMLEKEELIQNDEPITEVIVTQNDLEIIEVDQNQAESIEESTEKIIEDTSLVPEKFEELNEDVIENFQSTQNEVPLTEMIEMQPDIEITEVNQNEAESFEEALEKIIEDSPPLPEESLSEIIEMQPDFEMTGNNENQAETIEEPIEKSIEDTPQVQEKCEEVIHDVLEDLVVTQNQEPITETIVMQHIEEVAEVLNVMPCEAEQSMQNSEFFASPVSSNNEVIPGNGEENNSQDHSEINQCEDETIEHQEKNIIFEESIYVDVVEVTEPVIHVEAITSEYVPNEEIAPKLVGKDILILESPVTTETNETHFDYGQSNREDSDMYSSRVS